DNSDNEVTDDLIGDKKKVFEFLNTSNLAELSLLSGCSQKKADAIIGNIQRLMKKCVGLAQQLESAVAAGDRSSQRLPSDRRACLYPRKYYGNPEERRQLRIEYARGLDKFDVVVTTYTMVSSCPEERKMFRITPMHYVIYDEAHMLKNMSTQRYDNLLKIKSKHRLLLTGTPLQNNLLELMSLLAFKSKTTKKAEGTVEDEPAFEQSQIVQAKRIMKPFVLRRLKRDVLQDLPKKTNHTELVTMSDKQKNQYDDLIAGFKAKDGILANHPLLLRYHYQGHQLQKMAARLAKDPTYKEKNDHYAFQDLLCMSDFQIHQLTLTHACISNHGVPDELILDSGKFRHLDEMLPRLQADGHRVLLFSQFTMMLDILEPFLTIRGYRYLRLDGSTAVVDRVPLPAPGRQHRRRRQVTYTRMHITVHHDAGHPGALPHHPRVPLPAPGRQHRRRRQVTYTRMHITVHHDAGHPGALPHHPRVPLSAAGRQHRRCRQAGGLGINLTAADTVIIHDIDFNPYNDKQAEDRMGQTRPVTIYRLLSAGTIEEGIYQVAQEKLNLEKHVTGADGKRYNHHSNAKSEGADPKSVVRLLSAALGLHSST
ncbi:putative helicase, partial [Operophtera brumata]